MKQFSLLLICAAILFSCCKDKDDDKKPDITPNGNVAGHPLDELGLPYATTEGLNTMGCLINGEPWLPLRVTFSGDLVYNIPFQLAGNGQLNIQFLKQYDGASQTLSIGAFPVLAVGQYDMSTAPGVYIDDLNGCGSFNLDSTYTNYLQFENVDFDQQILSGTFEMRAVNDNCDTLTFTQGRFDLSS